MFVWGAGGGTVVLADRHIACKGFDSNGGQVHPSKRQGVDNGRLSSDPTIAKAPRNVRDVAARYMFEMPSFVENNVSLK